MAGSASMAGGGGTTAAGAGGTTGGGGGGTTGGGGGGTTAGGGGGITAAGGGGVAGGAGTTSGGGGGAAAGAGGTSGAPLTKVGAPVILGSLGSAFGPESAPLFFAFSKTHLVFTATSKNVRRAWVAPLSNIEPVEAPLPIGLDEIVADPQGERFFGSTFAYDGGGGEVCRVDSFVPGDATFQTLLSVPPTPATSRLSLSISPERVCLLRGEGVVCQKRADGSVQIGPSSANPRFQIAHTTQAVYGVAQSIVVTEKSTLTRWAFDAQVVTTALPDCNKVVTAGDTTWAQRSDGKLLVGHEGTAGFAEVDASVPAGTSLVSLAARGHDLFAIGWAGTTSTLYRIGEEGTTTVARDGLCQQADQLSLTGDALAWVCPGATIVRAPLVQ